MVDDVNRPDMGPESKSGSNSALRRFGDVMKGTGIFDPDDWPVRSLLGSAVALAILVFVIAVARHGVAHVRENQVGVKVHNLSGDLELMDQAGYHVFMPYLARFYVLDKTIQEMSFRPQLRGGMGMQAAAIPPRAPVELRTADGNSVKLNVTVNFKLDPERAVEVMRGSGQDRRYIDLWIESFTRQASLATFGKLDTEQLYNAEQRNAMAEEARDIMNEALVPRGIEVAAVIPGDVEFFAEYTQIINEKKQADQEVEEQQAQARRFLEEQARKLVEANQQGQSRMARFKGESENRIIQARADIDKIRREADGNYAGTLLSADAALYSASSEAEGRRLTLFTEADGLASQARAMTGEGGTYMVAREYAKRLQNVRFIGTPITRDPAVRNFNVHSDEAAVTAGAPAGRPAPGAAQPFTPPPGAGQPFTPPPGAVQPFSPPPGAAQPFSPPPGAAAAPPGQGGHAFAPQGGMTP